MTFDDYQKQALTTVVSTGDGFKDTLHWVLGICGESGEVAEKVKKIIRDKSGQISKNDKQDLVRELGDVLWYIAILAHDLGSTFDEVADNNLMKLKDRKLRGVIGGSGDNR
jgi:NTP pyrophosphatase (non-canonical NTP hydrolase)